MSETSTTGPSIDTTPEPKPPMNEDTKCMCAVIVISLVFVGAMSCGAFILTGGQ